VVTEREEELTAEANKEGEERVFPKNLFDFFAFAVFLLPGILPLRDSVCGDILRYSAASGAV
jgi:hypothetical protein